MSRIPGHSAEHEATGLAEFVALMAFTMSLVALSIDAMEPLGHVAGTAAAAIGSATTLLAVVLGYLIGQAYDGTLIPMAVGFVSLISLSVLLTAIVK